jgi:hypothetical protein
MHHPAVSQIRFAYSSGRAFYERKLVSTAVES